MINTNYYFRGGVKFMLKKNFVKKAIYIFTVTALISSALTFTAASESHGELKAPDLNVIEE